MIHWLTINLLSIIPCNPSSNPSSNPSKPKLRLAPVDPLANYQFHNPSKPPINPVESSGCPGVIDKLDYIQGMGFDCIWITPVVKSLDYTGYFAEDFLWWFPHGFQGRFLGIFWENHGNFMGLMGVYMDLYGFIWDNHGIYMGLLENLTGSLMIVSLDNHMVFSWTLTGWYWDFAPLVRVCYWTWPFIVDLPVVSDECPYRVKFTRRGMRFLRFVCLRGFHRCLISFCWLPSGKHTKNYGISPFLIGKSTINVPFSIVFGMFTRGYLHLVIQMHITIGSFIMTNRQSGLG